MDILRITSERSDLDDLIDCLRRPPKRAFFDNLVVDFLANVSRELLGHVEGRRRADIVSVAFFFRRAGIRRLQSLVPQGTVNVVRRPIGGVFHIAPANVDTMFLYSLGMSMLMGNHNVVKVSSRMGRSASIILDVIENVMRQEAFRPLQSEVKLLAYDNDERITSRLSRECQMRVVWGGDETIARIRAVPLASTARELCFPDRISYSIIHVGRYLRLPVDERNNLAAKFYNDVYWFDQKGCSSPRWLYWLSPSEGQYPKARLDFFQRLQKIVSLKEFRLPWSAAIENLNLSYSAILSGEIDGLRWHSNELVELESCEGVKSDMWLGGTGILRNRHVADLEDLAQFAHEKDQTVTYYGLSTESVEALAAGTSACGALRYVPIGEALSFSPIWDGLNLFEQMSQAIWVSCDAPVEG